MALRWPVVRHGLAKIRPQMVMGRLASFCHGVRKTCRLVRPLRLLVDFFSLLPLSDKYPIRGLPAGLCPYIVPLLAA